MGTSLRITSLDRLAPQVVDLLTTFRIPALAMQSAHCSWTRSRPAQVDVPGEHVPRAAHPAERDHRLQRDAAGGSRGRWSRIFSRTRRVPRAGKHLLGLINDILDLSKIEAGKMELFLETFDVRRWSRKSSATIHPLVEKNGNRLRLLPTRIGTMRADLTKVRQAFFNLLSNASKFTERGTVSLAVAWDSRTVP